MIRIINGKRYNTETATTVAFVGNSLSYSDFKHDETSLYRTPKGGWFLAGASGPAGRWAESTGNGGYRGGEGVEPLTTEQARAILELYGETDALETYFSEIIEDA